MTQTPSRLSLRTAAATPSGTMNTLLRAGLGGVLLALTAACSGDMDAGSDEIEGELEDQGSELVDVDFSAMPEEAGVIEKATFNDNATFNGFNVGCTAAQKQLINAAEARAREILNIAGPAGADARINRGTLKAQRFRLFFVPDGSATPPPAGTRDAVDTTVFRVGQKSVNLLRALATAVHTCHGGNESVVQRDGVFLTCNERVSLLAATAFAGGAENPIRWCDAGLSESVNNRAVTLLHELTHQDRTADATGIPAGRVFDDNRSGPLYNAQSWSQWFRANLP